MSDENLIVFTHRYYLACARPKYMRPDIVVVTQAEDAPDSVALPHIESDIMVRSKKDGNINDAKFKLWIE